MYKSRVKVFYARDDHKGLEDEINDWIIANEDVHVLMVRSTQSGRLDCHYSVIIHYEIKL